MSTVYSSTVLYGASPNANVWSAMISVELPAVTELEHDDFLVWHLQLQRSIIRVHPLVFSTVWHRLKSDSHKSSAARYRNRSFQQHLHQWPQLLPSHCPTNQYDLNFFASQLKIQVYWCPFHKLPTSSLKSAVKLWSAPCLKLPPQSSRSKNDPTKWLFWTTNSHQHLTWWLNI